MYTLAVDAVDGAGNRSTQATASGTTAACPAPPQPGGLVAAYSFDGGTGSTLADSSGKGNAGVISGPSWTSAGKNGGALTFDGVNDLVTIADTASLDLTTGMTLEAWVRPIATTSWRTVVTKEQPEQSRLRALRQLRRRAPERDRLDRLEARAGHRPWLERAAHVDLDASRNDLRWQSASASSSTARRSPRVL